MTSESETLDLLSPSKRASDNVPKGSIQQERNVNPLNPNDMSDGSVASMADQIDDSIDEVVGEEIGTNTDSTSSQSVTLRHGSDEQERNSEIATCNGNPM